jgi:arylsulfatase A-like enzyme
MTLPRPVRTLLAALALLGTLGCGADPVPRPVGGEPGTSPYAADGAWRDGRPIVPRKGHNLVLLVVDTWRADAVGLQGARAATPPSPRTMPFTEQWAAGGVACSEAVAPAPWTAPSIVSLLTGLAPHEHGVVHAEATPRLVAAVTTYAEVLSRAHGYQTAAFTDGPWLHGAAHSLLQGFAEGSSAGVAPGPDGEPAEASGFWLGGAPGILAPWAEALDPQRPFFLFLHTFEAHDPYGPENQPRRTRPSTAEAAQREREILAFDVGAVPTPQEITRVFLLDRLGREALWRAYGPRLPGLVTPTLYAGFDPSRDAAVLGEFRRAYDRGLVAVDEGLRRLVAWLEGRGLLEDTLFVLVGDHGEAFGEHGHVNHGHTLHDEVVHVPLVFRGPAPFDRPRVVADPVALVDVLPTFFDWAGLPALPREDAVSLLPALRGTPARGAAPSEMLLTDDMIGPGRRLVAHGARSGRWKYLIEHDLDTGRVVESLFDLAADPGARRNLLGADGAGLPADLPAAFCAGVEAARDRIDDRVLGGTALPGSIVFDQPVAPDWQRPAPCGTR